MLQVGVLGVAICRHTPGSGRRAEAVPSRTSGGGSSGCSQPARPARWCACLVSTTGGTASPRPCPSPNADILLGFKARISNWEAVQAARGLRGWSQCPDPDCLLVCSWGGVQCDARNHVYKLELGCHSAQGCPGGVPLRGTLGPGLEVLESLQTLDLGTNALSGSLPPQWGLNGTFPALQLL